MENSWHKSLSGRLPPPNGYFSYGVKPAPLPSFSGLFALFTATLKAQGVFVQPVFLEAGDSRGQRRRLAHGRVVEQYLEHALAPPIPGLTFHARHAMNEDYKLAELLVGIAVDPFGQFRQRAVTHGFELLGQFARQHRLAFGAENLGHLLEAFEDAVRTFIKNERAAFLAQLFIRGAARGGFGRREPFKNKTVGRKAGGRQRRDRRAGTGHGYHGEARLPGGSHQTEARGAPE